MTSIQFGAHLNIYQREYLTAEEEEQHSEYETFRMMGSPGRQKPASLRPDPQTMKALYDAYDDGMHSPLVITGDKESLLRAGIDPTDVFECPRLRGNSNNRDILLTDEEADEFRKHAQAFQKAGKEDRYVDSYIQGSVVHLREGYAGNMHHGRRTYQERTTAALAGETIYLEPSSPPRKLFPFHGR